jgi:hypothetical protein
MSRWVLQHYGGVARVPLEEWSAHMGQGRGGDAEGVGVAQVLLGGEGYAAQVI